MMCARLQVVVLAAPLAEGGRDAAAERLTKAQKMLGAPPAGPRRMPGADGVRLEQMLRVDKARAGPAHCRPKMAGRYGGSVFVRARAPKGTSA